MAGPRVLIVYGSRYGQTAKIAWHIADVLTEAHLRVTVARVENAPRQIAPTDFDAIVVGAPVHVGRHDRAVVRFVRAQRAALAAVPSAFFSVSNAAARGDEGGRAVAQGYVADFLAATAWRPTTTERFGGAIAYRKYPFPLRWVMRSIAQREGRPTDTSRDHELTDWTAVERFALATLDLVAPRVAGARVVAPVMIELADARETLVRR